MAKKPPDTTIVRAALARDNEARVIAESALEGERIISVVRIALIVVRAGVYGPLEAASLHQPPDRLLLALAGGYFLFAVGCWAALWLFVKPDAAKARSVPWVFNAVDFGFIVAAALISFWHGRATQNEFGAIALGILICFQIARFSPVQPVAATLLAILAYGGLGITMGRFTWPPFVFVSLSFLGLGGLVLWMNLHIHRMFIALRRRDNLTRFLPPSVAERVMALGDGALAPVQREVTVLFTDIRDFTTLSESLPPREVLEFLDGYLGQMAHIVKAHGGTVNKFLGDGMLAFWGVPDSDPAHAEKALRAALDMRKKLAELNAERAFAGAPPIRMGVGIHSGLVAAGMLGGADQHEYTIIGDAVNVASRVEGLTKALGVDVLVTQSAWERASGGFLGERLAEEQVKGREARVVVYALTSRRPAEERPPISAAG